MADIDWTQVGERIRERRTALGLSQKDVAEPDYTSAYVSLVESGARRASNEAIDHIASKLKTDSGHLLHGHPEGLAGRLAVALQRARIESRTGDAELGRTQLLEVLEQARHYRLHLLEAKAHEYLGAVEERRDELAAATEHFERALALYEGEPSHLRFAAVAGAARCRNFAGEVRYAIHMLEDYLLELQRDGLEDPTALMRTYSALVGAYWFAGLNKEAAHAAERALELSPGVADPEHIACMNTNVAGVLLDMGRLDEALEANRRAEAAFDSIGWRREVAMARYNLCCVLIEKGDLDEARDGLSDALQTLREVDAPDEEIVVVINQLAKLERVAGDTAAAAAHLADAEAHLDAATGRTRAEYRRELALLTDDAAAREKGLLEAADLYVAADAFSESAAALQTVGDLRSASGDHEGASRAYRAALDTSSTRRA